VTETTVAAVRPAPRVAPPPEPAAPRPRLWALDALRIVAIAGVVAIHIIGLMVTRPSAPHTRSWWAALVVYQGSNWVVPVFIMISGALVLAPRAHADGVLAFYRKRFVRILPALVVWHLVYLLGIRLWLRGEHVSRTQLLAWLVDAKLFTALYFLWLIAGLYLVAPILAAFLHAGGRRRALLLAAGALTWTLVAWTIPSAVQAAGLDRPVTLGAWTQWWPYVGYFVAGWALHRVVLSGRALAATAVVTVAVLAETIWQYGTRDAHPLLNQLLPLGYVSVQTAVTSIGVFLIALGLGARWQPGPRALTGLRRVSEATFGVFLCHLVFLEFARRLWPAVVAADSLTVLCVTFAAVLAAAFAASMAAARVPYLRSVF
jgi:surface polysaccharide O-acyltransferase-like enzyme